MHINKKLFCRLDTTSIPIPAAIPIDCITSNIDQYTGTYIIYNNIVVLIISSLSVMMKP